MISFLKATPIDKVELTSGANAQAYILSPNQAICVLPGTSRKDSNSQEISITIETRDIIQSQVTIELLTKFKFLVYDSACMICNTTMCSLDKVCYLFNIHFSNFMA